MCILGIESRDALGVQLREPFLGTFNKLKDNPMGYTSIAYPTDELRIPDWFKDLPFDNEAMEQTILDQKLDNLIGVLDWDIQSTETSNTFNKLFEF